MPKIPENEFMLSDRQRYARIAIVVAIVIVAVGVWLFWTKIYESPSNVFWGMIDNNLSTSSVTNSTFQTQSGETLSENIQLSLGGNDLADAISTLSNSGTSIKTEEINTISNDYVRYLSIKTSQKSSSGKSLNFKSLLGIWGESKASSSSNFSQLLPNNLLGVFPISDLSPEQEGQTISLAKSDKAYTINNSAVHHQVINGRLQYKYNVKILPYGYLEFAEAVAKDDGLSTFKGVNLATYKNQAAATFVVTVDVLSRELVSVIYPGNTQKNYYSGYDIVTSPRAVPTNTISLNLLQSKLQSIK